ncbi:ligase-associated DNA damage response endonuclease PdeM [Aquabacterium sp.]|uniref:ligase-associated DNA damage response endonuclease PdeM n=1 Tax=Aquabacterium sp. TaxID=1872578 RepID=UPI001998FB8D|nr:ligase-associated DNA damage response endonuclease PdeM [Aquabacterium sp.]MBC7700734.1 ligase-associated DNA damage response endonuclease PdeM [Aquabacterium sp.]
MDPGIDHTLNWPPKAPTRLSLQLMPERAAFEPTTRTLFVADVHLGKAAVFRARGLPVPQGTTTSTLARLSQALERCQARHLVVLGDFLHAKESHASGTLAALSNWRQHHPHLQCLVIEGNHDLHAGRVHASFGIQSVAGPYVHGCLRGVHHPPEPGSHEAPGTLTLAGHVHPVVHLRSRTDSLRLPVFWLSQGVLTLPAFGEFTGGFAINPAADPEGEVFVVSEQVLPLARKPKH